MKKQLFLKIAMLALCVAVLAGCSKTERFGIGDCSSDYDGITARIKSITADEDGTYLEIEWNNETEYETSYGEYYGIERMVDGEWVSCLINSGFVYMDTGYPLFAGVKHAKGYNISESFDISSVGKYRFRSYLFVHETGDGSDSVWCNVYAEFDVKK